MLGRGEEKEKGLERGVVCVYIDVLIPIRLTPAQAKSSNLRTPVRCSYWRTIVTVLPFQQASLAPF